MPSRRHHPRRPAGRARHRRPSEAHLQRSADRRSSRADIRSRPCASLDALPEVEKTSLFWHRRARRAPERNTSASTSCGARSSRDGVVVESIEPVVPSLEDVFLDVVERAGGARGVKKALAVGRKELRQIVRDRRTLLILVFVPAFFLLLYGYALNFDIRHVQLGGRGSRRHAREPRGRVGLRQLRLLRPCVAHVFDRRARPSGCSISTTARAVLVIPEGFGRDVGAGHEATVQVIISGDNANTATTVHGLCRQHPSHGWRRSCAPGSVADSAADHRRAAHLGITPSCAARSFSCPGSSPTSR